MISRKIRQRETWNKLVKENQTEKKGSEEDDKEKSEDRNTDEDTDENKEIRIRVLLTDTGFQNEHHTYVHILSGGLEREWHMGELKEKIIIPEQKNGIQVLSVQRQQGNPVYRGTLEIIPEEKGFLLINELPLEEYLKSVVPSEMPSTYEKEALKAQAVCARTYACKQMESHVLQKYNVHVDDSVNYQVYANIAAGPSTDAAVDETRDQVLTYQGKLIEAYYFSTSAGETETDEVWGAGDSAPYLKSVSCRFDAEKPWSRWKVSIPWNEIKERAEQKAEGKGEFRGMEIEKKSQSGAVSGLRVILEKGSFLVEDEYSIRQFLAPEGQEITENNGEKTPGGVLLPSAWFEINLNTGENVVIEGRGYGHGVGMSQTAADEMAKEGYSFSEILNYFFSDVEIRKIENCYKHS